MTRFRKPTGDEVRERRSTLSERAGSAGLPLPGAVVEMRHAIGMSQEAFAGIVGLTRRQLAEIEQGKANPTVDTLRRIGRPFGFEVGFVKAPATAGTPGRRRGPGNDPGPVGGSDPEALEPTF